MSDDDVTFWRKENVDDDKKKFTIEVVNKAFKNYNNYYDVCCFIAKEFKEKYKNRWTVFGYNKYKGFGYSDYKDTFIGIEYKKQAKITITNHK